MSATPYPTLQFAVKNADGQSWIHISSDPSENDLTVILTNSTGSTVTFNPGSPAELNAQASGVSTIYIFFNGLVTDEHI